MSDEPHGSGDGVPSRGAHPYTESTRPRTRRRWVLPVSIAGGVAVVAVGAVIAALLLAPAPKQQAAASPKPTTPASASPSASPKPAAKPSPRVRIDCESVLDRADVAAYLGATPTLRRDAPVDLLTTAWLQQGGLGCVWSVGDHRLRVSALPLDVMPAGYVDMLRASGGDTDALPSVDAPPVTCLNDRCDARAGTDTVAIHVTESMYADGPASTDPAVFTPLAVTAMQRIAATGAPAPAWVAPDDGIVPEVDTCEAFDPDGVIGAALGTEIVYTRGYYEDPPLLEGAALMSGPTRSCEPDGGIDSSSFGQSGAPIVHILPGARWAWDRLSATAVADGGSTLDLAGADAAVEWRMADPGSTETGIHRITVLRGDTVLIAEVYSTEFASSTVVTAMSAWLMRYAA